ncbi:eukaryotic translation initiation factor 4E-like isoform X2 [Penaeus japonicus]|uniref:eukaryotic translation initiation factor 4E-like isoform X2 n=1 Tax=Penaeus japonicus TaxID=27405 RepID=UPI001C70BDF8|nr:eukaryotic translation initiation factor 4E-like isoform X2 [Penaeus japonicus]
MTLILVNNDKQQQKKGEEEGGQKTVAPDMLIKHPLQNTWTLWFFKIESNRSWEDCQVEIASFNTVEDFWALYNHIEPASRLKVGCDYSMFKQGIKPMWEDEHNCRGGRWLINLNKQQRSTELDNFWMEVLLLMIGESFEEHSDEVCGAVVNVRGKGDKIGVWTADAKKNDSILKIGQVLEGSFGTSPQVEALISSSHRHHAKVWIHRQEQVYCLTLATVHSNKSVITFWRCSNQRFLCQMCFHQTLCWREETMFFF